MATKKATPKKTTKKTVAKKMTKRTVAKKDSVSKKQDESLYFWCGILIALAAVGAFMLFAWGVGKMIGR